MATTMAVQGVTCDQLSAALGDMNGTVLVVRGPSDDSAVKDFFDRATVAAAAGAGRKVVWRQDDPTVCGRVDALYRGNDDCGAMCKKGALVSTLPVTASTDEIDDAYLQAESMG